MNVRINQYHFFVCQRTLFLHLSLRAWMNIIYCSDRFMMHVKTPFGRSKGNLFVLCKNIFVFIWQQSSDESKNLLCYVNSKTWEWHMRNCQFMENCANNRSVVLIACSASCYTCQAASIPQKRYKISLLFLKTNLWQKI